MFWDRYKALCDSAQKSPSAAGKEIGVSADAVHKWKNGAKPKGAILSKIASYFGCSVDYLLGNVDNYAPAPPGKEKSTRPEGQGEDGHPLMPKLYDAMKLLPISDAQKVLEYAQMLSAKHSQ